MSAVLVTGGAGFIGSHFCKVLGATGRDYVAYDNLSRGNRRSVPTGKLVVGDLRDTQLLCETIQRNGVTAVVHFAALAYVRESMEKPDLYWLNNVEGPRSLLEAMRDTKIRHLIFSSSCATYGVPPVLPISLDSIQRPINPYGHTKLACEWLIKDLAPTLNLSFTLLRYFNVAGSDPELEIGEVHEPETHIIPAILLKMLGTNNDPLKIYGRTHPTPDGTCVRDFVHVADLARVHLHALDYLESGRPSRAFNVGLGRGTSINELLATCQDVTGVGVDPVYEPVHPGDPPVLTADPGDTWDQLGLRPLYPDVRQMVQHSWDWMRLKRQEWLDAQR